MALAFGIWLGLPGRYEQSADDIEKAMDQPNRRARRVSRHFTPMDWFNRNKRAPDRLNRHRIRLARPDEKKR